MLHSTNCGGSRVRARADPSSTRTVTGEVVGGAKARADALAALRDVTRHGDVTSALRDVTRPDDERVTVARQQAGHECVQLSHRLPAPLPAHVASQPVVSK